MILNYSSEYKNDVEEMLNERSSPKPRLESYIFTIAGEMFSECSFIYVAGGRAAGFIGLIASLSGTDLYVYALAVKKAYRHQNIGALLIERAVIYANKNDYERISFPINSSNRQSYFLFNKVANKLNKKLVKTSEYSGDTFLEITYTLFLKQKE